MYIFYTLVFVLHKLREREQECMQLGQGRS